MAEQNISPRDFFATESAIADLGLIACPGAEELCKLQLVIPAKTEGALNRVDMDGAENRRSDAKMILRKIHESETKTEE